MAIVVIATVPGGTAEQDELVQRALDLDGNPPRGALFRVAGAIEGGWRIISAWQSEEDFDVFRRQRGPSLQDVGRQVPDIEIWPVETLRITPMQ